MRIRHSKSQQKQSEAWDVFIRQPFHLRSHTVLLHEPAEPRFRCCSNDMQVRWSVGGRMFSLLVPVIKWMRLDQFVSGFLTDIQSDRELSGAGGVLKVSGVLKRAGELQDFTHMKRGWAAPRSDQQLSDWLTPNTALINNGNSASNYSSFNVKPRFNVLSNGGSVCVRGWRCSSGCDVKQVSCDLRWNLIPVFLLELKRI